jgi:hypothetical protein
LDTSHAPTLVRGFFFYTQRWEVIFFISES